MIVDTHAHINMNPLADTADQVIEAALFAGLTGIVVPGADLQTSEMSLQLALRYSEIVPGVGIHPEAVQEEIERHGNFNEDFLRSLEKLTHNPAVGAIGEIGLDYYRLPDNDYLNIIDAQRMVFKRQLTLARTLNLPALIHTRTPEAIHDALEDIKSIYGNGEFKGIFHCFSGTFEDYQQIEELDGYIGVSGIITFPNSIALQDVISKIPLSKVVLETDAPFLSPVPHRGKTNTPANVTIVALKLAEILNTSVSTVNQQTGDNVLKLFPQFRDN